MVFTDSKDLFKDEHASLGSAPDICHADTQPPDAAPSNIRVLTSVRPEVAYSSMNRRSESVNINRLLFFELKNCLKNILEIKKLTARKKDRRNMTQIVKFQMDLLSPNQVSDLYIIFLRDIFQDHLCEISFQFFSSY